MSLVWSTSTGGSQIVDAKLGRTSNTTQSDSRSQRARHRPGNTVETVRSMRAR